MAPALPRLCGSIRAERESRQQISRRRGARPPGQACGGLGLRAAPRCAVSFSDTASRRTAVGWAPRVRGEQFNAGQRAVVDTQAPERVERETQHVTGVHADHTAVGDDQHLVAVGMGRGNVVDRPDDARAHVRERLAAGRRTVERRFEPALVGVTIALTDLIDGAALPLAEAQLGQLGQHAQRHSPAARELRRLAGASERTDVRGDEPPPGEGATECFRLPPTQGGESHVGGTLEAPQRIPLRLPVPGQDELHASSRPFMPAPSPRPARRADGPASRRGRAAPPPGRSAATPPSP